MMKIGLGEVLFIKPNKNTYHYRQDNHACNRHIEGEVWLVYTYVAW